MRTLKTAKLRQAGSRLVAKGWEWEKWDILAKRYKIGKVQRSNEQHGNDS